MKNKLKLIFYSFFVWLGISFVIISCDADTEIDKTVDEILGAQPSIESFSPQTADIQSKITVSGTFLNFAEKAYIGGVECQITQRVNSETLEIQVASNAVSGPIKIITSAEKEATSNQEITITYPIPNVTLSFPDSGEVNENITIEGENLEAITKVMFGEIEGTIQFQESQAVVVSVPNNENSPVNVNIHYNTNSGETTSTLKEDFTILIPTPNITNWPAIMSRDHEVTITGEDMNLITSVFIAEEEVTLNSLSSTAITFNVPLAIPTGYQDISINYGSNGTLVKEDVPYINGQYENYIEFDSYSEDVFVINYTKDPLAIQQLNGTVEQPPFPGNSYYNLQMNTATGSTIARMQIDGETTNETYNNILEAGNFNDNPVLHFWINTENTEPILKIYIGGTGSENRRQLSGSDINTGSDWKLYAVRLNGFIPSISSINDVLEIRLNTGSGVDTFPVIANFDWFIVTDSVLTEFGAIDVTDSFSPAG